jgi:pimeloyl-ACP methyl ester carboxylesterase
MGDTFELADGRTLGWTEQGDPDGQPVLLFHGLPGSRLTRHPDGSIAQRLGLRVLSFDRPGIGLSTPQRRRRMLDWPHDMAEFADAQGIEQFAVLGWSGGGPYALAVAHELAERVTQVCLVASVTPLAGTALARHLSPNLRRRARLGRILPLLVQATVAWEARALARDPEGALRRAFARGPECDRAVLDDPELLRTLIESRQEAYRQGTRGVLADALLYLRPWGFDPADVRAPVTLWHGELDGTLAPELGRRLAATFPEADARFVPDAGHMLCLTNWQEILSQLVVPTFPRTSY